jgi:ADP-ribose pyrophosphatase YjhB (NUDIX family)
MCRFVLHGLKGGIFELSLRTRPSMIRETIGKLWKLLPKAARRRIVRSTQTNFTVSVAAIVVNEKREILLLDHVLRPHSGWGFPGGFLDANERPADAIKREVKEETGIDLDDLRLHRILVLEKHVEIIFFARPVGEARVLSSEIYELGWFGIHSLPDGTSVSQAILISEVLTNLFDNPATEN